MSEEEDGKIRIRDVILFAALAALTLGPLWRWALYGMTGEVMVAWALTTGVIVIGIGLASVPLSTPENVCLRYGKAFIVGDITSRICYSCDMKREFNERSPTLVRKQQEEETDSE